MRLALVAVGTVVLATGVLLLLEDRFVYFPSREPLTGWEADWLKVEQQRFETEDGLALHGWWHPGRNRERGPVILWCHGNAGNITHRAENLHQIVRRGLAVFIFDYRGYGKSEGKPSEQGLYRDARAAWRHLTGELGVAPARVVCFGRSLGAAVALQLSLDRPVAGLVMESAFKSVPAMARRRVPFLPVGRLMRNRYDNLRKVGDLEVPVLFVHGRQDQLVPIEHGRAVFEAAPEPKDFYAVDRAGHNNAYAVGGRAYFERLVAFCRRVLARSEPRP